MKFAPIDKWPIKYKRPILISGPCSAESRDQVLETAEGLVNVGIDILRAGIWKPRTRPGAFEGIGSVGLEWLAEAGSKFKVPVTTEVANASHVEQALKAGVDILWLGARTTVNPFTLQEIADSLQGVDIPVMIKNPVNPDIQLWIGAIERIYNTGINRIIAIHRGFSSYDNTKYRNVPLWEIPIELKRRYPDLPIICDPSHISGKRSLLQQVSQKAIDLNFEGLMIEAHRNPDEALSDNEQQLTPAALQNLIDDLVIREHAVGDELVLASLDHLRNAIDILDEDVLKILAERMGIVEEIGAFKRDHNITILQPERWSEIVETRGSSAHSKELSSDLILRIFELIHQESIRKQTLIMNAKEVNQ